MIESLKNYIESLNAGEREAFAQAVGMNVKSLGHVYRGTRPTSIEGAILIDQATNGLVKMEELRPDFVTGFDYVRSTKPAPAPAVNSDGRTAKEFILDWLMTGETLSQAQANEHFYGIRLSSRMSEFRKAGFPICSNTDERKRSHYYLPAEFISDYAMLGEAVAIDKFRIMAKDKLKKSLDKQGA